jgi:hypothetical protein
MCDQALVALATLATVDYEMASLLLLIAPYYLALLSFHSYGTSCDMAYKEQSNLCFSRIPPVHRSGDER